MSGTDVPIERGESREELHAVLDNLMARIEAEWGEYHFQKVPQVRVQIGTVRATIDDLFDTNPPLPYQVP